MGCDIHSFVETKIDGKWQRFEKEVFKDSYSDNRLTEYPFDWRSYSMFGFLADVRNYSHCKPISAPKGLPDDSEYLNTPLKEPENYSYYGYDNGTAYTIKGKIECDADYHSLSWLTFKELLDFDYEKTFWDRRVSKTTHYPNGGTFTNGAALAEKGEGKTITYREHLGEGFFRDIDVIVESMNISDSYEHFNKLKGKLLISILANLPLKDMHCIDCKKYKDSAVCYKCEFAAVNSVCDEIDSVYMKMQVTKRDLISTIISAYKL